MNLCAALSIEDGSSPLVALVGAGGKSSTMMRLAQELSVQQQKKVLVTTTTAIYYPPEASSDFVFTWPKDGPPFDACFAELKTALRHKSGGSITVIGLPHHDKDKLKGLPADEIAQLARGGLFDAILVEADGARGCSIKSPALHEPVIPGDSSLVLGLIGMDCYGAKLSDALVHRPLQLLALTGKKVGDLIDDEVVGCLVAAPDGLFKGTPAGARQVLFLNKCRDTKTLAIARRLGEQLLRALPKLDRVIIGAVQEAAPLAILLK